PANDPGFGYGKFAWPQVDAPDPDHAVFNSAVYKAAVNVEAANVENKAASFDAAVDTSGYLDGFFTISAANEHFIDVDLGNSGYGWGAAHPLTGISSYLWRVDLRRPLTPADVLRPESDWKTALVAPAVAKLQKRFGPDGTWKDEELRKAVAAIIVDPTSWDLSRQGLTVTFGQYAVAAYAAGMPTVSFTWQELKPFLNPAFDPGLLPSPEPAQN
ncbi:MAG TPA: RsiV family protein, partial [Acidobacteriaceae bacterium]|nr:RsiV family protein [Acidobacteriaceae bacterium]